VRASALTIGNDVDKPQDVGLARCPVTEMSVEHLELELEIVREAYNIFRGTGEFIQHSMQPVIDMWGIRLRELEAEILERTLLVDTKQL
jgi:hypothetical protein